MTEEKKEDNVYWKWACKLCVEGDTQVKRCNKYAMEIGKLYTSCDTCNLDTDLKLAAYFGKKFKCYLCDTRDGSEELIKDIDPRDNKELYS